MLKDLTSLTVLRRIVGGAMIGVEMTLSCSVRCDLCYNIVLYHSVGYTIRLDNLSCHNNQCDYILCSENDYLYFIQ